MSRFAVMLYPNFSLQEITCLTSVLSVWYEEKIDFIASEDKEYYSEEGLRVIPTKLIPDTNITDYECVILPGTINPLPALYDEKLINFLKSGKDTDIVFSAISSSPLLYVLDRLPVQSWKLPLSLIMGKGDSTFCCRPLTGSTWFAKSIFSKVFLLLLISTPFP